MEGNKREGSPRKRKKARSEEGGIGGDKMDWGLRKRKKAESEEGKVIIQGNEDNGMRQNGIKFSKAEESWG